jgi:hypothetical protein
MHSCSETHDTGNNVQLRVRAASQSQHEGVQHTLVTGHQLMHPRAMSSVHAERFHFSVQRHETRAMHDARSHARASTHARGYGSQCRFQANTKDSSHSGMAVAEAAPYHPGRATSYMWLLAPPTPKDAWKNPLRGRRRQLAKSRTQLTTPKLNALLSSTRPVLTTDAGDCGCQCSPCGALVGVTTLACGRGWRSSHACTYVPLKIVRSLYKFCWIVLPLPKLSGSSKMCLTNNIL